MNLIKLLPVERYTITSNLTRDEIYKRLVEQVEPRKSYRWWGTVAGKKYEGEVGANSFTIRRVIRYRNSFLPEITGTVYTDRNKTYIRIRMQPDTIVLIFMMFWMCMVGLLSIGVVAQQMIRFHADKFTFIPVVMFILGYLLTMIGFRPESSRAKHFLAKLFNAEPA